MSLSRAKCGYVSSFLDACDAIPQALQRIVSFEHESRMQDRDTRDYISRTVNSFRGASRRGETDGSPLIEEDMARLQNAIEVLRKQYREKVSLAEQAQDVLDEWKRCLVDAHATDVATTSLVKLSKSDPRKAAELLEKGRKEIPVDRPEVPGGCASVSTFVTEDKTPTKPSSSSKDSSSGAGKHKSKPSSSSAPKPNSGVLIQKQKVAKRPAEKPAGAPPSKKPKVSSQISQGQASDSKAATKKVEGGASDGSKKKKKSKKVESSSSQEEGWMRHYKISVWRGSGKLPPLCGPVPPVQSYIIPAGNFVAARNPTKGEAPSWMVATVVKYSQSRRVYEVEDVDAEEAKANKKGTKTTVPRESIIPLPLQMPDYTSNKEFPIGRKVIALYPKTTCFYEGKVVQTPSMMKSNFYLVEFMDDDDEDDEGGKRVQHALVLDYPNANQKLLAF